MGRILSLLVTAAALAVAGQTTAARPAEGKPTLTLDPSVPWRIERLGDKCRLSRSFGTGGERIAMAMEKFAPGDHFGLVVAGAPLRNKLTDRSKVRFEPAGGESVTPGVLAKMVGQPALVVSSMELFPEKETTLEAVPVAGQEPWRQSDPDLFALHVTPEQEASIDALTIEGLSSAPVKLALGPMDKPMANLRECAEGLMDQWGIDVEAHRHLTRSVAPVSSPGSWIGPDDYPAMMWLNHVIAIVYFRLTVGPDGRATQCNIQGTSTPAGFGYAVCAAMIRNARFTPALDRNGVPITSFWNNNVRFVFG